MAVLLLGCAPTSTHSFTEEEITLEPCPPTEQVSIADITDGPRASCDLAGAKFVFPDGAVAYFPGILHSRGRELSDYPDYTYFTNNLGIYGVVASRAERSSPNGPREYWGRPEAIELLKEDFGLK